MNSLNNQGRFTTVIDFVDNAQAIMMKIELERYIEGGIFNMFGRLSAAFQDEETGHGNMTQIVRRSGYNHIFIVTGPDHAFRWNGTELLKHKTFREEFTRNKPRYWSIIGQYTYHMVKTTKANCCKQKNPITLKVYSRRPTPSPDTLT